VIWLVCGSRNGHRCATHRALDKARETLGAPTLVIHGGCAGVDLIADEWARQAGIHTARVDALWKQNGKAAGPMRNRAMLALRPDVVVALPGGSGTRNMASAARSAGVRVVSMALQRGGL